MSKKTKTDKKSNGNYEYNLKVVGQKKRQKVIFSKPIRRGKFFQDSFFSIFGCRALPVSLLLFS